MLGMEPPVTEQPVQSTLAVDLVDLGDLHGKAILRGSSPKQIIARDPDGLVVRPLGSGADSG